MAAAISFSATPERGYVHLSHTRSPNGTIFYRSTDDGLRVVVQFSKAPERALAAQDLAELAHEGALENGCVIFDVPFRSAASAIWRAHGIRGRCLARCQPCAADRARSRRDPSHRSQECAACARDFLLMIKCLRVLENGGALTTKAMNDNRGVPSAKRKDILLCTDIARVVDEAVEALRDDPDVYVRGGALVRVISSDGTDTTTIKRDVSAPVLRRAATQWVRERLSLRAGFYTENERGNQSFESPPVWVANAVLERGEWPGYRGLNACSTSPTMRSDGTVIQVAGYDAGSRILFVPRVAYPPVQENPQLPAALAARDRLLNVIDDFPLSTLGRAGWLALVLTLVARDLIDGSVPLFAIDAPTAGSGKGLLVRAAHLIAFGVDIAHMSLPQNDEEMRKQITTSLLAGDPAVLLDNVSVPLGGDSLDAIITAPVWKVRLLGKNEDSGALVPRIVWATTGNGLEFIGDLGRRTLRIPIETCLESPEERTDFKHPDRAGEDRLLAWVRSRRTSLVVDALTILRAWHVAGRPGTAKPWGSFDGWSATIARAVQWLDMPDPGEGRATKYATSDPTKSALATVYAAIARLGGDRGVTARDLINTVTTRSNGPPTGEDDLAEAIDALSSSRFEPAARARVLGRKLKVGRIINGQKLVAEIGSARSVRYRLEPAEGAAGERDERSE